MWTVRYKSDRMPRGCPEIQVPYDSFQHACRHAPRPAPGRCGKPHLTMETGRLSPRTQRIPRDMSPMFVFPTSLKRDL